MSGYYRNEDDLIYQLKEKNYKLEVGMLKKSYVCNKKYKLYYKTIQYITLKNPSVNHQSNFAHCFQNYNHRDCVKNYHKKRQREESYKSLIQSFDKTGYNNKIPIIVDKEWNIIDGYHRMEYFIERKIDRDTKILVLRIFE